SLGQLYRLCQCNLFLLSGFVVGFGLAVTAFAEAASAPADTAETLQTIRKKYDLPALAVVVVTNGTICDRAAVGVRKEGDNTPVTTNDLFHIGSCTKTMNATLAATFIQKGALPRP